MRADRNRAADMKAVAEIRGLQSRAAELRAAQAENERRAAASRHARSEAAAAEIERGWMSTVEEGAFDPGLSRHWFRALDGARADERRLGEEADAAAEAARARQGEWQAASARAEAAEAQAGAAARRAMRRHEETRLAAVEDRAAARGGRR